MRAKDRQNKQIRRNLVGEAEELYQKALEANRNGNWFSAIGFLEDCISLAPEQPAYLALLAELKFNSGDFTGSYDAATLWCKNDKSQKIDKDLRGEKKPASENKESNFGEAIKSINKKDKSSKNDKTQRILILSILNQDKPHTSKAYDLLDKYFTKEDPQYMELRGEIDNIQLRIDAGKPAKKTDPQFSDDEDKE